MQLHNPHSTATPSQILAAAARNERLQRINGALALRKAEDAAKADNIQVGMLERLIKVHGEKEEPPRSKDWFYIVERERKCPSVKQIQGMVAERYGVSRDDIISQRRTSVVVKPRQIAMYLVKEMTTLSYPAIGRHFGNRDHTTCLYTCKKIADMILTDSDFSLEISNIREWLTA